MPSRSPTAQRFPLVYRPLPLPFGQGGDEFAAEVGDVWDHPASDQVGSDRETVDYVFHSHLRRPRMAPLARLVWVRVWDARGRLEVGPLLPPSSGPTQVGPTPGISFHALLSRKEHADLIVTL